MTIDCRFISKVENKVNGEIPETVIYLRKKEDIVQFIREIVEDVTIDPEQSMENLERLLNELEQIS